MTPAPHDLSRLSGLIEAAKAEADAMGPGFGSVASLLGQALNEVGTRAAGTLSAPGRHPDEGTPPEDLTTENDR